MLFGYFCKMQINEFKIELTKRNVLFGQGLISLQKCNLDIFTFPNCEAFLFECFFLGRYYFIKNALARFQIVKFYCASQSFLISHCTGGKWRK